MHRQVIRERQCTLYTSQTRSHRLRIEKLWIDEIDMLRRQMNAKRDEVRWRKNVVELRERIDTLAFRLVVRKRQRPRLFFFERVLAGFRHEQPVGNQRSAEAHTRR